MVTAIEVGDQLLTGRSVPPSVTLPPGPNPVPAMVTVSPSWARPALTPVTFEFTVRLPALMTWPSERVKTTAPEVEFAGTVKLMLLSVQLEPMPWPSSVAEPLLP